jgi:hypothetical protein
MTFVACGVAAACGDPVHDDAVAALGPEAASVGPGPTHRPGQPCLTCHGGSGPGSPQMIVAGTVYAVKDQDQPLVGGTVHLTDANGGEIDVETNAVGNFFVPLSSWTPTAPIHVSVSLGDQTASMTTHIGHDGSCATCHVAPASRRSVGRVYLVIDAQDLPGAGKP